MEEAVGDGYVEYVDLAGRGFYHGCGDVCDGQEYCGRVSDGVGGEAVQLLGRLMGGDGASCLFEVLVFRLLE